MRTLLPRRTATDPNMSMINIILLLLIFFLIAGTIAPAPDREVNLVTVDELETRAPQDALVLLADGRLRHAGAEAEIEAYVQGLDAQRVARLLPDRDAPATRLIEVTRLLRQGGAERVILLTERALQ